MIRFKIRTAMIGAMALARLVGAQLQGRRRAADPLKLESIDVQTLSGQQVQLKLHLSGPAPEPLPFTIDKPARIAFDLPNTTLALASRRIDVRSGGVDTVLAAEANGRTRAGRQRRLRCCPTRPRSTATPSSSRSGSQPGDAAAQTAARRAPARLRRGAGRARHPHHRFPPRLRRHRPRDRAAHRSAHAGQRAPGRQSGRRRFRRHADAQESDAPL